MKIKVLGLKKQNFKFDDGKIIDGMNVYYGKDITSNGSGVETGKMFLSDTKINQLRVDISVGKSYDIYFDEWKKPAFMQEIR